MAASILARILIGVKMLQTQEGRTRGLSNVQVWLVNVPFPHLLICTVRQIWRTSFFGRKGPKEKCLDFAGIQLQVPNLLVLPFFLVVAMICVEARSSSLSRNKICLAVGLKRQQWHASNLGPTKQFHPNFVVIPAK